jgi:hypothetical protein
MFSGCYNPEGTFTMSPGFGLPDGITAVGANFCQSMFSGCKGDAFNMSEGFTLPRGITVVGDGFCREMFNGCAGGAFSMTAGFTLPASIEGMIGNTPDAVDNFCYGMFSGCNGEGFSMTSGFNLPQSIGGKGVGNGFCQGMFSGCSGIGFTEMVDSFNLPVIAPTEGVSVGSDFCAGMFRSCSNLTMSEGSTFALPTGITTVGTNFCYEMFNYCSKIVIKGTFKFPALPYDEVAKSGVFMRTLANIQVNQTVSATAIINNAATPPDPRATFLNGANRWSDYSDIDVNWKTSPPSPPTT